MYGQDRMTGTRGLAAPYQRCDDVALACGIGPEREGALPIAGQHIGHPASRPASHPASHDASLELLLVMARPHAVSAYPAPG